MACEKISDVSAQILCTRWEEPQSAPTSTIYSHVNVGRPLGPGPDDIPVGCIVHEYEATSHRTKMRSTFTLPAFLPDQFVHSFRKHNITEMGQFLKFLPQLYQQKNGN